MATAYATVEQLAAYLVSDVPNDAARLLIRASDRIDDFVLAPFEIDDSDLPTDTDIAAALAEAACAQVEFWIEVGEEHDVDGVRGQVSVPGTSFSAPPTLSPRARSALSRAGLMGLGATSI